jgi:hypothetical protein
MKRKYLIHFAILLLFLASCTPQPAVSGAGLPDVTETPVAAIEPARTILKTNDGDLIYVSARFVDETPMETPAPGHKLLMIILERADGQPIDLEGFNDEHIEIVVLGNDGSRTLSTMGGFLGEEFAIGFRVPDSAGTFTLEWGDNPPIKVEPSGN